MNSGFFDGDCMQPLRLGSDNKLRFFCNVHTTMRANGTFPERLHTKKILSKVSVGFYSRQFNGAAIAFTAFRALNTKLKAEMNQMRGHLSEWTRNMNEAEQ